MGSHQESLAQVLGRACREFGNKPAFTCLGKTLTYADIDRLSSDFAAYLLTETDLQPGDRIALQLPNILQYPVAVLGVFKAGLVLVNINPMYTASELKHQLLDSGARAVVALSNTAANLADILPDTGLQWIILTEPGDLHDFPKRQLINLAARYRLRKTASPGIKGSVSFRKALALGARASLDDKGREGKESADGLALLQYSGGTTGVAKGAMLSHANLLANMRQILSHMQDEFPPSGGVMVAPLPLYHVYAFTVNLLFSMQAGLQTVLVPNPRDVKAMIKAMAAQKIHGFIGINPLYNALCGSDAFKALDLSQLRISSSGGMALSQKTGQRWYELTGCRILEGYGLTECSPLVCCNRSLEYRQGSVGTPLPDTELRLLDRKGVEVSQGTPGELYVRGPQVMVGYWQREKETREVLSEDGWLRTGDIAVLDEEGFVRIVDRIKDLIIVSGFNVFPAEIEAVVLKHPQVREAAAVGVRRGDGSERVKLVVVKEDPALDKQELIDYCSRHLAPYKVPKIVEFRDKLPKSNVGKVLRRDLRD